MEASPKLGGLRPISLQFRMMCLQWVLCSRPLSLSPTFTTMTSLPASVRLAISLLINLATPEWIAPQSPRSEVTPTMRCFAALSSGALISAFSYRARAPVPYTRAGFSCLSARAYFAAATIFMDFVIFWMFLMDFNRMVMSFRVAMFLTCPHCGENTNALVLANMVTPLKVRRSGPM